MCLYTNKILIVLLLCQASSSVKNSLTIFAIISTGIRDLPNLFTTVIDDIQVDYYDGNGIRKQSSVLWKNISDSYQSPIFSKEVLNSLNLGFTVYLIKLGTLNPDEDVHVLQCMNGCELNETPPEVVTFQQCGYNGENFMKLYSKNLTWTAQHPLAEQLKPLWDSAQDGLNNITLFLTQICPQMLKQFVTVGALQREDLTSVALLQKTPSSPVSCFATGFYPNTAEMFWRRDGVEIQNDEEPIEILPNHDNTFQMSVDLNVSSIASEDWKRYDCVFKLNNKTKLTRLEKAAISTNWVLDPVPPSSSPSHSPSPSPSSEFPVDLAIGLVVGLILLCFCISGLFLWKNVNNASKFPDTSSYPTYPRTIENCQHNFEIQ